MNEEMTIIHKTTEELLRRLQIDGLVEVKNGREALVINIMTQDAALLIGAQGETLAAFQHLLRSLLHRQLGEFRAIVVDVEGYRQRHEDALMAMASRTAKRVQMTGRPEALNPMSAADRRLIHMKIKELDGVVSESIGDRDERKVVIKPIMKKIW